MEINTKITEINSLMVGDLVYRVDFNTPVPTKIIGMEVVNYDKMEYVVDVLNKNGYIVQLYLNEIEPIKLTKEILEKNGFVWNDLPFLQCWEQYGIMLHISGNGYEIICGENISLKINYLHQLQHLFRLCEIDKEIEL